MRDTTTPQAPKPEKKPTKRPAQSPPAPLAPRTPSRRQLQLRAKPDVLARARRCAADEAFHGGAPVSLPMLLAKALGTYLAAYEDQAGPLTEPEGAQS